MIKKMFLSVLGIQQKNDEVREMKDEVKKEMESVTRKYKKLNRVILKEGVTLDIARAVGAVKKNQQYVRR